jgi:hypothetical protein
MQIKLKNTKKNIMKKRKNQFKSTKYVFRNVMNKHVNKTIQYKMIEKNMQIQKLKLKIQK